MGGVSLRKSIIFHLNSWRISESPRGAGRHLQIFAVLLLCLALIPATVSADGIDLVTVGSGTVSGGLWSDPGVMWNTSWPSTGGVEVTKAYAMPAYDDLEWARLYLAVYIGSTSEAKQTTIEVSIDGDGDGTFDTLALESLNSTDIGVTPGKPHITRESSNYVLWYDVKESISAQNPAVLVNTTGSFDGRVKAACLVAAYNDGDADRVYYRVNAGHFTGQGSTDFDLSDLPAGFADADLTNLYLASTEATEYTFNGDTIVAYDSDKVIYSGYNSFDVNASLVSGVNTFGWPGAGSYYRSVLALLSVKAQPADIEITAITPNAKEIFANEPNTIAATVKNNGTAASGAFSVSFSINGAVQNVSVPDLAAGNTTTVSVVDPAIRALGDAVTIVVTTDASPANNLTLTKSVVYNGYKGKRYTGGDDITGLTNFTVTGGLVYSTGDSAYLGGSSGWTTYTANWTAADLSLPANATVEAAYLCAFYTYDKNQVMPENVSLSFNGVGVPYLAYYTDQKLYGTYNFPSGMVVYNVTDSFDLSGNSVTVTNLGTGASSFNGMTLFVVYEDPAATQKQILFNAGYDILSGKATYAASPEEATAYAPFAYHPLLGVNLSAARLITVAPAASAEGTLLFGNQIWTPAWNYSGVSNIGIDERDVTAYLNATPVAAFRSDNDYFDAACAVLVLEYGDPIVPPTPTPTPDNTGGGDDAGTIAAAGALSTGATASFSYSGTVSRVMVTVSRPTAGIMLAVTENGEIPVDGPSGAVYRYLETDLSYTTDDGIDEAVFEFSVPLSWLADQGLTVRDIVLMRYHNGVWTALPTELIGESGNEARYRATSPGFSYFAIVTEKNGASVAGESLGETPAVTVAPEQTPAATTPSTLAATTAPAATGTTSVQATTPQASPLLGILPFAALGVFLLMRRK
ncbi:APHP domain protein [Methanofollis liminatans DSM 4140]|uniref:APHP domain protein n=1 Tax=Methanofollis liminatans DSM 4140 TaxID=28892 RepID=J1L2Z8_9EURY|nr:APHP domain protein [Methanofollis liminatans DSM 4140]